MTEKQINQWLRRRFSLIGWVLLGYLAFMYLLVGMTVNVDQLSQILRGNFNPDWDAILGNGWGYILTIALGLTVLHSWKGPDYWRGEVFVKEKPMPGRVVIVMMAFCIGTQLVSSLWIMLLEAIANQFDYSFLPLLEEVSGASDTFSMFLYSAILAPIAEEVLFRGFVLRSLRPFGKRFAILGSAFLFGMYHGNLLQTPYAFLVGLLLGYVAAEYSTLWAVAIHMFNNLVVADLLSRLMMVLPETLGAILDWTILLGCFVASVVILIVKRKDIRAYRESEWMDRRCIKCFFTSAGILVLTILMALLMLTTV